MKRVYVAGMVAMLATSTTIGALEASAQSDTAPKSDWSGLMPNPNSGKLPSTSGLGTTTAPKSGNTSSINTFAPPTKSTFPSDNVLTRSNKPGILQSPVSAMAQEALALAQKGNWNDALEKVNKAIALDDKLDFLFSLRSKIYKNMGKEREAAKDLARFRELQVSQNQAAIDKYHVQQEQQAGIPDLRDRVKNFLGK